MKEKIKMWIFTKCIQIAAKIEPYKFKQCNIGLKFEAKPFGTTFTEVVPKYPSGLESVGKPIALETK